MDRFEGVRTVDYSKTQSTPSTEFVHADGDNTLAYFNKHVDDSEMSRYPFPDFEESVGSLTDCVRQWVKFFGLFDEIEGFRLYDRHARMNMPAESFGSAVEQCLPVIVSALTCPIGGTVLIEQPEVHLHPRLQHLMGDFLFQVSLTGRQVILETHSDHLVDRVRRRVSERFDQDGNDGVICLFFERENGASKVSEFYFDEFGTSPSWPKGFFDDSEEESLSLLRGFISKLGK